MSVSQLVECVPNFSEGRDLKVINAIKNSIVDTKGVHLLHIDIGFDANRTVMTFAGSPLAVSDAAFNACNIATQLIDMTKQTGTHPRLGVMDVCPLIALEGITSESLINYSYELAERLGSKLKIPIYLYEHSAKQSHRKRLEQIRKGGYETFASKMKRPEWVPDYGPRTFNKKTGATVLGVRDLLLAFNINLETTDVKTAQLIARKIRSSGYRGVPGTFKNLKAIGWFVEEFGCVQVSTNITDFKETPPHEVYEAIKREAENFNVKVSGSELIGLIPLAAILTAGKFYHPQGEETEELIRYAITGMGLADKNNFDPNERILDLVLRAHNLIA